MSLEDGYFVKVYIGSVCIKCKHFQHKKGSTSKRLIHGFVSFSDFMTEDPPLSPRVSYQGSTSKRLIHGFVSFSDFMTEGPLLPPGFSLLTLKHVLETLKLA